MLQIRWRKWVCVWKFFIPCVHSIKNHISEPLCRVYSAREWYCEVDKRTRTSLLFYNCSFHSFPFALFRFWSCFAPVCTILVNLFITIFTFSVFSLIILCLSFNFLWFVLIFIVKLIVFAVAQQCIPFIGKN